MDDLVSPFILFEDRLSAHATAQIYRDPVAIVRCDKPADLDQAFTQIEQGLARGLHAAGLFAYELGYALEPRLAALAASARDMPLLWFGLFERAQPIRPARLDAAFAERAPPSPITAVRPGHDRATHVDKVRRILDLIAAGDLYQVNLTFPMDFRYAGDPLALYAALRVRQPVAHGGLISMGDRTVLSVSPELWIETNRGDAWARPMKGTAPRGSDPAADRAAREGLAADPKQRAENLMITDLLRNDLARVSQPGSVRVPALFTVETYPSFHALTSTITARLAEGRSVHDRIAALFPCGSIVGAPKIRAAQVIAELEMGARGAYTGGLGVIRPNGDMRFNVAIRTAVITAGGAGRYGVGGGVVADSDPDAEYDEALLKARVLTDLSSDYGLIETFRWTIDDGFARLNRHLDRLESSAGQLGFAFDRGEAEAALEQTARRWSATPADEGRPPDRRVRLGLERNGTLAITTEIIAKPLAGPLRVGLAAARLDGADPFLRHKTTRREVYDQAFAEASAKGLDEALLLDRHGRLADGSRNTVLVELDGALFTPPLECGALPGILRRTLIEAGHAHPRILTLDDLTRAPRWFLGNSLHGLRPAVLVRSDGAAL